MDCKWVPTCLKWALSANGTCLQRELAANGTILPQMATCRVLGSPRQPAHPACGINKIQFAGLRRKIRFLIFYQTSNKTIIL